MIHKKVAFLLSVLCSASPAAFASHSSDGCFNLSITQEDDRYINLATQFPSKFSALDFKLIKAMKEMYKDLSPEEAGAQDLNHNPLLVSTVQTWKDLFATHGAGKTAFLDAEITQRLQDSQLTLEWVSLLPMRFAAAISNAPTQEEINLYNWSFYEPNTRHESFFDQTIYTSHEAFKELMVKENLPSQICFRPKGKSGSVVMPIIGAAQLSLPEMVLMNLDHIFPVGIPLTPATSEVHGIKAPTAFGFAVHDDLHIKDAHNILLQELDNLPGSSQEYAAAHIVRQKHGLITDVLKFVFHKTLENAGMNLGDQSVRKTVLALFFGNHEQGSWPNTLYRAESLEDIIDAFVAFTLEQKNGRLSGISIRQDESEALHDRLHTSPLDGSTPFSGTDIENAFYPEGVSSGFDSHRSLFEELVRQRKSTQTLLKDHNVIKLATEASTDDGMSVFQTSKNDFTLHYRLNDAKGIRSLLSYAGIKISPVTTQDLGGLDIAAASSQALIYLNTIASHATDLMVNFGRHAKALLQSPEAKNLRVRNHKITWQGTDEEKIEFIRPFLLKDLDALESTVSLLAVKDCSLEKTQALAQAIGPNYDIFFSKEQDALPQMPIFEALKALDPGQIITLGKYADIFLPQGGFAFEKESMIKAFGPFSCEQIEAVAKHASVFVPKSKDVVSRSMILNALAHLSAPQIESAAMFHEILLSGSLDLSLGIIEKFKEMSCEQIEMLASHANTFLPKSKNNAEKVFCLNGLKGLSAPQIDAVAMCHDVFLSESLETYSIMSSFLEVQGLTPEKIHDVANLVREKVIAQNKPVTSLLISLAIINPDFLDIDLKKTL